MHIKHDFHLHTKVSFCADETATIKNYFERFRRMDIEKVAFTDHFWDSKKAEPENKWIAQYDYPYLAKIKEYIKEEGEVPFKVYFGCEVEYKPLDGGLIITEETAEKFDFVVAASSHTHHYLSKEELSSPVKVAEAMYTAFEDIISSDVSKYIGSMAHPFKPLGTTFHRDEVIDMISDDRYLSLLEKTAKKGIAFELSCSSFRVDVDGELKETYDAERLAALPYAKIIRLAKKAGCKFVVGSDAHGIDDHERWFPLGDILTDVFDIKEADIADVAR